MATRSLRDHIVTRTHGGPPNRACLPGSDAKWDGYLLGVEDAIAAAEEWLSERNGPIGRAIRDAPRDTAHAR